MYKVIKKSITAIKIFLKILFFIIVFISCLILSIPLIITNKKVQEVLIEEITTEISKKSEGEITVGGIDFSFFSGLILEDVTLKDPYGNLVADINKFHLDVKWRKLFRKKLIINNIILDNPTFHLITNNKGETNLQFFIDIFPKTEKKIEIPDILLELGTLQIINGDFQFDNTDRPYSKKSGFDPAHFRLKELNTDISIDYASKDSLYAHLNELSVTERNGLKLDNLSFTFGVGKKQMYINPLKIKLPSSTVLVDELSLKYDSLSQVFSTETLKKNVRITFSLKNAKVYGKDLKSLVPELENLNKPFIANGRVSYYNNNLDLHGFQATYGNNMLMKLSTTVRGIDRIEDTYIFANIQQISTKVQDLEDLISDIKKQPYVLPQEVKKLGQFKFTGNIVGFFSDIVAFGTLNTDAGKIHTDLKINYNTKTTDWKFDGKIGTEDVNLGKILNKYSDFNDIHLDVAFNGEKKANKPLSGHVNGIISSFDYKQYEFDNIIINGKFSEKNVNAEVKYKDPENGYIDIIANLDIDENNAYNISLDGKIDTVCLAAMKIIDVFPTFKFSTIIQSKLKLTTLNDIEGYVAIDSINLYNDNIQMSPNGIILVAENTEDGKHIWLESDLAKLDLNGQIDFYTLANNIKHLVSKELTNIPKLATVKKEGNNNFRLEADIAPLSDYSYFFAKKMSIDDTTHVSAFFNDSLDLIELNAFSNHIDLGKVNIDSLNIHLHNFTEKLDLNVGAYYQSRIDTTEIKINTNLLDNKVNLNLWFENSVEKLFAGEIKTRFEFNEIKNNKDIDLSCYFLPSNLILADSTWNVEEGRIHYNEEVLRVDSVGFNGPNQHLRVHGVSSKQKHADLIHVSLKEIDLKYLSEVLYMPDIKLLGIVSGDVLAGDVLNKPILRANVSCRQFGLNDFPLGDVIEATANYNHEKEQIELHGLVENATKDTSEVNGYVSIVKNEMLLDIDINKLQLGFIKPYLSSFANDLRATVSGKLYVGGPFDAIEIWGDAYAKDAMLSIDFLKSEFYFEDSVKILKNAFILKDIELKDRYGNTGLVNGTVSHHLFRDFEYKINIDVNNILAFNTTEVDSPDFYGRLFATGSANIVGDMNSVNIDVIAKPEKNSYFAIPIDSYSSATDNQFITYISPKESISAREERKKQRRKRVSESVTSKLNVKLNVEATPDLEAQIIMDSHTSDDVIKARGNGNLQIEIDNNINVKIYGNYEITEGEYNFSFQGALRKKFEVDNESSISFDGDPMTNCNMNINAKYQTTASLSDLLESSVTSYLNSNIVKVDCIANITGPLLQPIIKFDIKLPTAEEEVQRLVKAAINTDDMMSQQMVSLLLLGRFYNPSVTQTSTSSYSTQLATSFATATISSQLNYWLSQISNNVNLGLNYIDNSDTDLDNRQFAVNISTNFLDNRLILNGNVGYRTQYGNEDFIGDFELEYKLIKSGRLRLKAYNKTNDRLYSTALYTQGLGIMYREDFDTWENLGKYYKEVFRKKTPEEKALEKKEKEEEKIRRAKERENKRILKEDRKRRHKEYVAKQKEEKARVKAEKKRLKEEKKKQKNNL